MKILRKEVKIIALVTVLFMFSFVGQAWADFEYETVGGDPSISFMMTLLIPALVMIGIFGVMVLAGLIHIEIQTDEDKDA